MKTRPNAFTLIELLVVVSIIAVLISILLPSLAHAKRNAKRVACATNLRQLSIASRAYAGANEDFLPAMAGQATSAYNYSNLSWNIVGSAGPNASYYGPGLLFSSGTLTNPRVLLCPSQKSDSFNGSSWATPFGKVAGVTYRPSYNFQPYHTAGKVAYPKLTQLTNNVFLANDIIQNDTELAHAGDSGTPLWNVVYADGHAVGIRASDVFKKLLSYPNHGVGGGSTTNPTTGWARFDECIGLLGKDAANGSITN
jgi:prepilin-type N-terminal cleavage/methylation domain-containing protein